ncbi:MAG TPA: trypsin-like peptidase domain-containing protein [Solirubrobacteraceae bacterium]|nr:trypsin-like peptidase domain-containing protein [Solirubrobacteraceae bacterium]
MSVAAGRPAMMLAIGALALAGCGGSGGHGGSSTGAGQTAPTSTSRVEVLKALPGGNFDPQAIYQRSAPGVVTVISEFARAANPLSPQGGGGAGLGSGFVVSPKGEIATNAHVVTSGEGADIRRARHVYVQFNDHNQVPATIVGADPFSDVALIRVDPAGLTLRPLPLGASAALVVGAPVVAIGSPFGEPESLSVGVVSGLDRTIDSLTNFQISGAIQTDAAINRGNSGGPLVDSRGAVIGINSQIQSTTGGGEGVGFAVPVDTVKRSLDELRRHGKVSYAYLGVSTVAVFPQLAQHFGLPVSSGSWVQQVTGGGPAAAAGIQAGNQASRFQVRQYRTGGDVIVKAGGHTLQGEDALGRVVASYRAGQEIDLELYRGGQRRTVRVKLGERPLTRPQISAP